MLETAVFFFFFFMGGYTIKMLLVEKIGSVGCNPGYCYSAIAVKSNSDANHIYEPQKLNFSSELIYNKFRLILFLPF